MKPIQRGSSLIDLTVSVAIIAIFAAVALPAYQDYLVRANVSEMILAANGMKTSIAEWYQNNREMPTAGSISTNAKSKYVGSVEWNGTNITVHATSAEPELTGKQLTLTAVPLPARGQINWTCGGTIAAKYLPASCR